MVSRLALLFGLGSLVLGCTDDTYVIGAVCGAVGTCPSAGAGGGGGGSGGVPGGSAGAAGQAGAPQGGFTLDLTGSGVERLPQELLGATAAHLLISSDIEATTWPARIGDGFDVVKNAALAPVVPWPFADRGSALSHAGAVAFTTSSEWADASDGALAIEAVFRGEPGGVLLSQRDAAAGLDLALNADGQLIASLSSGTASLSVSSQKLVPDAWHHCLLFFDSAEGAQIICNGQAGDAVTVPAGFALGPIAAPATLGSSASAELYWAELASWHAGTWGARGAWGDAARERFARLVGTYADGANEPLPLSEMRASGAYIDMSPVDQPELRRLHPVGEHWPRVVCRPAGVEPRLCGLLVEGSSSRQIAAELFTLDKWNQAELSVAGARGNGASGAPSLFTLVPSATNGAHTLSFDLTFADGPATLSLFARPLGGKLLRLDVPGVASATFDVARAAVVDSSGTRVVSAEAWGDGLVRISYSFDIAPGPGSLQLTLLADDGSAAFAGNGDASSLQAGDVELRFRQFSTPLPMLAPIQAADLLVFPAGKGNFPAGGSFSIDADFWLPAAPLVVDAAIVNANFATQYEQQINLFVTAPQSNVRFGSLLGKAAPWTVTDAALVTDGEPHQVRATVAAGKATLVVDGATTERDAMPYDTSMLDRIEVGASKNSSGALTGILRHVSIAAP
ncbi:MAG TPA: hypothetical protein VHB79_32935 [Polyangiaceae bacterium]|nr:hypothetical protein [Polyangiaceae bacterium]